MKTLDRFMHADGDPARLVQDVFDEAREAKVAAHAARVEALLRRTPEHLVRGGRSVSRPIIAIELGLWFECAHGAAAALGITYNTAYLRAYKKLRVDGVTLRFTDQMSEVDWRRFNDAKIKEAVVA